MMMFRYTASVLLLAAVGAYDVPSLTPENYDEKTEGKGVFLKFFSPTVRLQYVL